MAISFGPKLGLLYNALIGESYYDQLRLFLQSLDQLIMGSVINATQSAPPSSPSGGDAYLLTGGTPSGAWTGQAGKIAVWDAQLTNSGTNTVVPGWIFLTPKAGWTIWNVAASALTVFNGTSWNPFTSGADFPTNTDITSMTGIPNTTISTTGYAYNDSTNPQTVIGANAVGGGATPNGLQYGSGTWNAGGSTGNVILVGEGPWTGLDASGYGVGVSSVGTGATVMTGAGIQTTGTLQGNTVETLGDLIVQGVTRIGLGTAGSHASILSRGTNNAGIALNPVNISTLQVGISLNANGSGTAHVGLVGFGGTYPTQTTVGASGGASALPATPTGYLPIVVNGTEYVVPYYLPS